MIKQTLTLLALSSIGGSHFLSNAANKNCLCLPRDYLSIPNSMNGVDTQRLVVYLYKSPGQQNIRVHIPNVVKQSLLPDFPVEDDDELIDNDQLTLQGIFGNSKVVSINHKSLYNAPGAQIYPSLNRHLNHPISNQFSKGGNIPNIILHGRTYPNRLVFLNQCTRNIPFFGNFLPNYPIVDGKNDPGNPNISGGMKITHGSINGPLQHNGKFNVPLNIYSELNSRPNNLINHGIDLLKVEGPDPRNPYYSGTINIKHNYPIQDGINDPFNPNLSGNIKITRHGSINGPLQKSEKFNVPVAVYSELNSRPNNLINQGTDLINTEIPGPINPKYSGTINIKHDYLTQDGIRDPDNPNFSGDIKITHGSFNTPLQHSDNLNVPLNIHSDGNSRPSHLTNPGIFFLNTLNSDPNNPNSSGKIKVTHNFPIAGGITDPDNPNNFDMIKQTHNFPIAGGITDPDNPNNFDMLKQTHNFPIAGGITDPDNPNNFDMIKQTHNFPIAGGITDPDNPNNFDMIKQTHNFPIAGGISEPDNPNNFDMIKQTQNFPIAGGITDPDNPNYPGNSPDDFRFAGAITDLDNFNSSKINITNDSISVPLYNSGKFNVPLNIHSKVNSRPSNLINTGVNLINNEKILDFNIPANKITTPGYYWGPYIDSIVDDREVNLPGMFHPGIIKMSNHKLQPGINITSTDNFFNQSTLLNPIKEISINGSISINPLVNGQFLNSVNVNSDLINEPNNLISPGVGNEKNLDSDKNQINNVTVNGTLDPLHYNENVNSSTIEEKVLGMVVPDDTLKGKEKISSESHSKVHEPNNTLKPDMEITHTEKNKHSSTPVNYVTEIITHEGMNGKPNHNGHGLVPGKFEFDVISQQINPGKQILSDPNNTTYKKINFTIPVGINEFSDLLHSGGVHHKQLGNIPEEAKKALLNIISDNSRHDNYEFGSFDDWLNHQLTTSDSTLNIKTIKNLTEKILGDNGIRINKQGVLTSSDGNVFNLTKLKLVPLLIGNPVGYDTIIRNGVIYKNKINLPSNIRYKNSALVAFDNPFRILGIIPLGVSLNKDKGLALDSKFVKLKTPLDGIKIDRTSYLPSYLTGKPELPINYVQNHRRPCTSENCFSHRIVPGIEQEKDRIYPKTNDASTKIINLSEPSDERKLILSAINYDQGAIIPVVKNMTRKLKKLIADIDSERSAKDVTESPKEPEKPPLDYDEVPGFRIIGGNAATSSGTPVSSKGRSGIIT